MKHFFIDTPSAVRLIPGRTLEIQETSNVDELDVDGRLYLGSTDDDGNPTTALVDLAARDRSEIDAMMGSISAFSPFIRLTLHGCESPVAVHREHILMATRAAADDKDFPGATRIFLAHYGPIHVTQPYDEIEQLLAPVDEEGDASATA